MAFVRLENLNDFIQPSTSCVKPVEKKISGRVAKVSEISLSDCLACSGCITSSESVLIQHQNYDELFKVINNNKSSTNKRRVVVSMSLQSISSLAYKYSMTTQEAAERLTSFLLSIGCDKVYDINLARHLALVESYKEYVSRKVNPSQLPIISSICPGWICYAEKTNGELVLPFLSKVRSPQQIMGAILKEKETQNGGSRNDIFHVTLMPCYDKKLEASRADFQDANGIRDVDCVLTPIEIEEILISEEVSLLDFERVKLNVLFETGTSLDTPLTSNYGSVSGGYAENIIIGQAIDDLGTTNEALRNKIRYNTLKNSDFIELNIDETIIKSDSDSAKRPKVAIINGFRNIQTVVQRLKRKALKYDYIEIMACPSGCINGGAQCRPNDGHDQSQTIEAKKLLYSDIPDAELDTLTSDIKSQISSGLSFKDEKDLDRILYTEFHPVPKMKDLTVNW